VWTDGRDVLLTWRGQGGERLSTEWLDLYRKAVAPGSYLSDCTNEGTNFAGIGRRVAREVAKGARWGSEVSLPK
jgi:hypothetical protein